MANGKGERGPQGKRGLRGPPGPPGSGSAADVVGRVNATMGQYRVTFAAIVDVPSLTNVTAASFDAGSHTIAIGDTVLLLFGSTNVGIYSLAAGNDETHWNLSRVEWLDSDAECGARQIYVIHGGSGPMIWMQDGTTLAGLSYAPVAREVGRTYRSDPTVLTAASGTHAVITVPIAANTDTEVVIDWHCYDGTTTNRVLGQTVVNVARATGAPTIVSQVPGASYSDTTAGGSGPWNPIAAVNGNNLEVSLTADPNNQIIPRVVAYARSRNTSDAPAAVDPIVAARSALHATAPAIELYADVGRDPSSATPGTVVTALADQSGNGHNATVSGSVTYTPNASSKPALKFPASGGRIAFSGAIAASQSHTFAWRYKLGDAVGAAVEILLASNTSPAAMFVTINWTTGATTGVIRYSNVDSTGYDLGVVPDAGMHDYTLVIDNANTRATLYIDGVAQTPVTITAGKNAWAIPAIGGSYASAATYPLVSGDLHAFCYWGDAASATARDAAFRALATVAYGAHS